MIILASEKLCLTDLIDCGHCFGQCGKFHFKNEDTKKVIESFISKTGAIDTICRNSKCPCFLLYIEKNNAKYFVSLNCTREYIELKLPDKEVIIKPDEDYKTILNVQIKIIKKNISKRISRITDSFCKK